MNPFEKKAITTHHPLDKLEQKTEKAEKAEGLREKIATEVATHRSEEH